MKKVRPIESFQKGELFLQLSQHLKITNMREAIYTATFKGFKLLWKIDFDGEVRYRKIGHLPAFVNFNGGMYMAVAKRNFLGKVLSFFYYTGL